MKEAVRISRSTRPMGPVEFFEKKVLPKLDPTDVYDNIFESYTDHSWRGACPLHGGQNPTSFHVDPQTLRYYCFSRCGSGGSALAFLNGGTHPSGAAYVETVRKLADLAGVDHSCIDPSDAPDSESKEERRQAFLDAYVQAAHTELLGDSEAAEEARAYLIEDRGFERSAVEAMPFGIHSREVEREMERLGFGRDEIKASGLGKPAWLDRVVYPWRDYRRAGGIGTIWGRSLDDRQTKYMMLPVEDGYGRPKEQLLLFGLDRARRVEAERKRLVIVEGYFDVLRCQALGFDSVVAVGSTGKYLGNDLVWQKLSRLGFDEVCLALDNDDAGLEGQDAAIERGLRSQLGPRLYVVDPEVAYGPNKDPDALISDKGINGFKKLTRKADHALAYRAETIVLDHRGEEWTGREQDRAVDALAKYADEHAGLRDELNRHFWPVAEELIPNFEVDALEERRAAIREAKAERKHQRDVTHFFEAGQEALDEGDFDEARRLLREEAMPLAVSPKGEGGEEIKTLAEEMDGLHEHLKEARSHEFMGIAQRTIGDLDDALSGLRGLILLAAPPNVGKTALATQFMYDAVRHNDDVVGVLVSLEMPRQQIELRLFSRAAKLDYGTLMFGSGAAREPGDPVVFSKKEEKRLAAADQQLREVGERIEILDRKTCPMPSVAAVASRVQRLKDRTGATRAVVVVDYTNVWPLGGGGARGGSELDLDKRRIEEMRDLRDRLDGDAVIAISEVRKSAGTQKSAFGQGADIMGSARFTYAPDVVMTLQPFEEAETEAKVCGVKLKKSDESVMPLIARNLEKEGRGFVHLRIIKGRDGVSRKAIDLTFDHRRSNFRAGVATEGLLS